MSAIGTVDIYKKYLSKTKKDVRILYVARVTMAITALIGLLISFLQPNILWVFMIGGSVTASTFFPVILSLFWKKLSSNAVFTAVISSLIVGLPYSIYANVMGGQNHIVYAALISTFIPLIMCSIFRILKK